MMPDLGKYTVWVLSSYGVSLTLLVAIVVLSVVQARRTLAELTRMEEGRRQADGRDAVSGTGALDARERANG